MRRPTRPQYEIKRATRPSTLRRTKGARSPSCRHDAAVFSIGHSTRSIEAFVALLRLGAVTQVVDIRSFPRSRSNPAYNEDVLPGHLGNFQIEYLRIAELGGRRSKSKTVPAEVNGFWDNPSFHNYADYALSDTFRLGLDRLIDIGRDRRCAMMCRSGLVAVPPAHRRRPSARKGTSRSSI